MIKEKVYLIINIKPVGIWIPTVVMLMTNNEVVSQGIICSLKSDLRANQTKVSKFPEKFLFHDLKSSKNIPFLQSRFKSELSSKLARFYFKLILVDYERERYF